MARTTSTSKLANVAHVFPVCLILIAALLVTSCAPDVVPIDYIPNSKGTLERGRQLAHGLAGCGVCHGSVNSPVAPLIGGGTVVDSFGEVTAANLTRLPQSMSIAQIAQAIRVSEHPDGKRFGPESHYGYQWLSNIDLYAIATYIRSLKPQGSPTEGRGELGSMARLTDGFSVKFPTDPGYVPAISKQYRKEYGAYLVERVAQCSVCHTGKPTAFSNPQPLGGGTLELNGVVYNAPAITRKALEPWSDDELVKFLSNIPVTGKRKTKTNCPTQYYAKADKDDLLSMVHFLKGPK